MNNIYEIVCGIIFVLLNISLVLVVYYFNRHPIKKYGGKKLKPEELSKVIAKEIGNQPQFYTYEKKKTGKYSVYVLSHADNLTYEEEIKDHPVDFNGLPAEPISKSNFELIQTNEGFKVPGMEEMFKCPNNYEWNEKLKKCIEKPICNNYDNSVQLLYNRYYSEIDNPSITPVTSLEGETYHKRLYIRCSSLKQKPIIEVCSKENEQVDENAFKNSIDNNDNNNFSKKPCKIYDICDDNPKGTCHAYRINNIFGQALKINQYYKCNNKSKSEIHNCQKGYECNEISCHNNDICKPIDDCRPNIDYYFTTTPHSFYHCLSNKRQKIRCGENGIIKLSDNSYQCKVNNEYVYYPDNNFARKKTINGFKYESELLNGLQKTKLSWILFDEWFNKKFPKKFKDIPYPSLQPTFIKIDDDDKKFLYKNDSQRKFYENLNDIQLPTKFYYDKAEKWTSFSTKEDELLKILNSSIYTIDETKIIHLSASNSMKEISSTIKYLENENYEKSNDPKIYYNLKISSNDYGLYENFWIIFNGIIYKYLFKSKTIDTFGSSEDYYSFIGPVIDEPKKILDSHYNGSGKIIGKAFKKIEGIYYALCLEHDNKFEFKNKMIKHIDFENLSDDYNNKIRKLSLNIDNNVELNNILPKDFPLTEFSWDKLYVGKYYYDKKTEQLIVWHDHLFVLKLHYPIVKILNEKMGRKEDTDEKKELSIDNGQFVYYNYPTNIVDITYQNIYQPKYRTALATTFSYYNYNYTTPVVHWLSYIPIDPVCLDITQEKINNSKGDLNDSHSILKYITIKYPKVKKSTHIDTLLNIIQLKKFTLTLDNNEV